MSDGSIRFFKAHPLVLCTAESCTGGLVASKITDIPGASDFFWGAFVTYDESAKVSLGVAPTYLVEKGAVSKEVAEAMASSALHKMKQSLRIPGAGFSSKPLLAALSTTGIAGPTGGTGQSPVGSCWMALALEIRGQAPRVISCSIQNSKKNNRSQNKIEFAEAALAFLKAEIEKVCPLHS